MNTSNQTPKRYFIIVKFVAHRTPQEKSVDLILFKSIADKVSIRGKKCEVAINTPDTQLVVFYLTSNFNAGVIRSRIQSPSFEQTKDYSNVGSGSPIKGGDQMLIVEIGSDFDVIGLSNLSAFLQHPPQQYHTSVAQTPPPKTR